MEYGFLVAVETTDDLPIRGPDIEQAILDSFGGSVTKVDAQEMGEVTWIEGDPQIDG